ncbi:MAG TPA: HAD-IB family hydrolase [Mycobacteriales bacterium]|nr:HAD-IB family hydrolase [Mycobacteriales bacterium]
MADDAPDQLSRPTESGGRTLRHVLLTGATGFLGQAMLERLLSDYPELRISVLIRPKGTTSAADRARSLLTKPVFGPWRERVGEEIARTRFEAQVSAVEGDVSSPITGLPDDLDTVVHCASTVSFDPPIDEAFRTNVSGVTNLYDAVAALPSRPHVVHVSTAYVAGAYKGVVPEASLQHTVNWREELEAALSARTEVERSSRRPEVLTKALKDATAVHGKAGPQTSAAAAEDLRRQWVQERLVEYGRMRATSLGWPDVYTFTKALGERAVEELAVDLPLSIVRPAIVESALAHPYPGWIDGFKMADPLILAYGRGILREFPGAHDGILDIVPVDIVTNALIAVAENPPESGSPNYYHVGSGSRNPLTFGQLYDQVFEYFTKDPLPGERGAVKPPEWKFPGSRRIRRLMHTGDKALDAAEKILLHLPGSPLTREWMTKTHRQKRALDFLTRYADLYGTYTETEVIYTDDKLLALHRAQPAERQERAGFDSAVVDWTHYFQDVHCPAVTTVMRRPFGGSRGATPAKALVPGENIAAVFDLEGTLLSSNVLESYLWARLAQAPAAAWPGELVSLARSLPRYFAAERRDRGDFLRTFMRRYEGASEEAFRELVSAQLTDLLLRRAAPDALRQVRKHRAAGHRTILITGTLAQIVEPLHTLFDVVQASQLQVKDGRFTGFLELPPLVGEARAAWMRRYAAAEGLDLPASFAYGDSFSDRPLLEAVGNPVAVNPDARLYAHAKRKHWRIEEWGKHTRGPLETVLEVAR